MAQKYIGIPQQTLTDRVTGKGIDKYLENPSGKAFRVTGILGTDGNNYTVVEAGDWFDLATDVLVNPGKTRKATKEKVANFLRWFAIIGFYASANIALKGAFTSKDERATQRWIRARESGEPTRKNYTDVGAFCITPRKGKFHINTLKTSIRMPLVAVCSGFV